MYARFRFSGFALAALFAWIVTVSAQPQPPAQSPAGNATPQGQRPGGQGGPPGGGGQQAPDRRVAVPTAASTLADRPDSFYGEYVTVYATIEKSLTPTAFTIDQDPKTTAKEVVVLARRLHEPVEPNTYITVIGEVVKADANELTKVAKVAAAGLPPDVLSQYAGKPVIFADIVLTPALNDLAKFIPPPMTPEEEALDKAMKSVGQANGVMRKAVQGTDADLMKKATGILAPAFAETEAFWKKHNAPEAVKIAQTARTAVAELEKAAGMGNWNEAKKQAELVGQQCAACHKTFRERLEDGSFAVRKPAGGTQE